VFLRALVLTLLVSGIAVGEDWTTVKGLYYKAVDGDRSAGARAATLLDEMQRSRSDDPLLLAYRGSVFLLESSWAVAPWRKGKLAKRGLAMMDRAVELSPRQIEVRFVRAATTMRLPGIFRRGEQSASDFAEIAPLVPDAVRSGKLEARLGTAALHSHAVNREEAGDHAGARQACGLAVELGPQTPGAAGCRTLLAKK
jgi:hypothetical protein